MAQLFIQRDNAWQAERLSAWRHRLGGAPLRLDPTLPPAVDERGSLLARDSIAAPWVLIVGPDADVRHNGVAVAGGIRVLAHGDAITLGDPACPGTTAFFSTEEAAHVEAYAASPVSCARCCAEIEPGDSAVRCPACGVWHHQWGDRNCWTYAATCAACSQATPLDRGLQWTPQGL